MDSPRGDAEEPSTDDALNETGDVCVFVCVWVCVCGCVCVCVYMILSTSPELYVYVYVHLYITRSLQTIIRMVYIHVACRDHILICGQSRKHILIRVCREHILFAENTFEYEIRGHIVIGVHRTHSSVQRTHSSI